MKLSSAKELAESSCLFILLALALALSACGGKTEAAGTRAAENAAAFAQQSDPERESIRERCEEIASEACLDAAKAGSQDDDGTLAQSCIDEMEELLIQAGFDVLDTNGEYPPYLATADRFYTFWEQVRQGKAAQQEIIKITEAGSLAYTRFTYENGESMLYSMRYGFDENGVPGILAYEKHPVLDWELSDKGNFYFRIYPANDKHYADYTVVRLTPPDLELYDMTLRYILPVGYAAVNLFLCGWTEGDWGELSINDLWEYFYYSEYGEWFDPAAYAFQSDPFYYKIPAGEFENLVMPYFNIEAAEFRDLALYNGEGNYYPWKPLLTSEAVWCPAVLPEVTKYTNNPDGTVTLTVEVLSPDFKTDCLFAHEVTVRPLENGGFQYVENQVIYQSGYGLPSCKARLSSAS